jgi:hypothetical protein
VPLPSSLSQEVADDAVSAPISSARFPDNSPRRAVICLNFACFNTERLNSATAHSAPV